TATRSSRRSVTGAAAPSRCRRGRSTRRCTGWRRPGCSSATGTWSRGGAVACMRSAAGGARRCARSGRPGRRSPPASRPYLDAPGVTYTVERCADYFEYFPNARDCADAATQHHFEEVVTSRGAAGVLGLLVLSGLFLIRRRYPRGAGVRVLPESFAPTVAATLF